MPEQKPSVGRVVHYVNENGTHCAATIAHVWSDTCVNLGYLTPNGIAQSACSVVYAEPVEGACYTWHWPERVS